MVSIYGRIQHFFLHDIWRQEVIDRKGPVGWAYRLLRLAYVLVRELSNGQLNLRAMSLVYTTLLSMVPLLAVSFSVLKGFEVHNQVEPALRNFVSALGEKGDELVTTVLSFVENMRVGVLGSVGMALLIYTVISLIQKIESAFNFVWHAKSSRSLSRRFSDYLSVIIVGPVLVFSAMGITASAMNTELAHRLLEMETLGTLAVMGQKLMPYVFIILAFAFVYMAVPNTKVKVRSALAGAVVAGVLWQSAGVVFASFVASSTRQFDVYSGFAILILFMIWLYLSWLILLFGAQVAYFHQHPQQVRLGSGRIVLSPRHREQASLLIMILVTDRYVNDREPPTIDNLVEGVGLPGDTVGELIDILLEQGLLMESNTEPAQLLPKHDPGSLAVIRVLEVIRSAEERDYEVNTQALQHPALARLNEQLDGCNAAALDGMTLRELVSRTAESV